MQCEAVWMSAWDVQAGIVRAGAQVGTIAGAGATTKVEVQLCDQQASVTV